MVLRKPPVPAKSPIRSASCGAHAPGPVRAKAGLGYVEVASREVPAGTTAFYSTSLTMPLPSKCHSPTYLAAATVSV